MVNAAVFAHEVKTSCLCTRDISCLCTRDISCLCTRGETKQHI